MGAPVYLNPEHGARTPLGWRHSVAALAREVRAIVRRKNYEATIDLNVYPPGTYSYTVTVSGFTGEGNEEWVVTSDPQTDLQLSDATARILQSVEHQIDRWRSEGVLLGRIPRINVPVPSTKPVRRE